MHSKPPCGLVTSTVVAMPPLLVAETKVALVQRSCGYALRPTLRIDEIERAVKVRVYPAQLFDSEAKSCRVPATHAAHRRNRAGRQGVLSEACRFG